MNKKIIKLTESDLHKIVKESVNRVIKEGYGDYPEIYDKIQSIKEYMGADNLVERMSYFLYSEGLIDKFEEYLYSSGQMSDFDQL